MCQYIATIKEQAQKRAEHPYPLHNCGKQTCVVRRKSEVFRHICRYPERNGGCGNLAYHAYQKIWDKTYLSVNGTTGVVSTNKPTTDKTVDMRRLKNAENSK